MRGCELNSCDRKLKQNDIIMSSNRTISSVNWNGNSVCMQFDGDVEQKWLELVWTNRGIVVWWIHQAAKLKMLLMTCTYLIKKLLDYRSTEAFVVHGLFFGCRCCWCCRYRFHWMGFHVLRPHSLLYCELVPAVICSLGILHALNHPRNVNYPTACEDPKPLSPIHADARSVDMLSLMNRTPVCYRRFFSHHEIDAPINTIDTTKWMCWEEKEKNRIFISLI